MNRVNHSSKTTTTVKPILRILAILGILVQTIALSACGDDGGGGEPPISEPVFIMLDYGGQTYKTVAIGTQTWFAENLNYNANGGVCYNNSESNCANYGKLYDYNTAMTVCPPGWHLPTRGEWEDLIIFVGGNAGKLKAKEGWNGGGNGTDNYGFSALPGGWYAPPAGSYYGDVFSDAGNIGYWWTSSDNTFMDGMSGHYFFNFQMIYDYHGIKLDTDTPSRRYSVRCVKN